jgi:biopolymer transport protein TolR
MQSEINVTPLVDVCLVLLIIFMVLTPAMVTGSTVSLPETRHSSEGAEAPLSITVMADETVLVGSTIVRRADVASELQRVHAQRTSGSVAVRGDKRVSYGAVAEVLDACRAAGWSDVKLVSLKTTTQS